MFRMLIHKISVIIRWITIWVTRIIRFLTHDVWFLKESDFSRWKARGVRDLKTMVLMVNTFSDQKIGYQITALAYKSMLSVVPAIAIGFYLTDGLGLREKFAQILQANLGEQDRQHCENGRERSLRLYLHGLLRVDCAVADDYRPAGLQQCVEGG